MLQEASKSKGGKAKRYKVTASTVIECDGQVLLVQQGRGSTKGRWNLPGGRVDLGETAEDAASRETLEEAGYDVRLGELIGTYQYRNRRGVPCLQMVFAARIQSGFARADGVEISDVGWFDTSQLSRLMECGQVVRGRVLKAILRDAARIGSIQLERTNALAAA